MVNIAEPPLYNKAFAGTKILIEDYAEVLGAGVRQVVAMRTWPRHPSHHSGCDVQSQLDFLRTCRLGFGRSSLLMDGGAMFGFSHLGVAKALYFQDMLPRVITGSGSGALPATLLCTRTNQELIALFNGEGVDLSAFSPGRKASRQRRINPGAGLLFFLQWLTLLLCERCPGLDLKVLEECVRDNIGDITFEEAYMRSKRVLNITLPIPRKGDRRNMLNYLESPHVVSPNPFLRHVGRPVTESTAHMVCGRGVQCQILAFLARNHPLQRPHRSYYPLPRENILSDLDGTQLRV
jgi:TAG lipase/lysophosphatidylethanolamine acyltransferase